MSCVRPFRLLAVSLAAAALAAQTATAQTRPRKVSDFSAATVAEWTDTTAKVIEDAGFAPPVAARLLGYVHLAAYEAAVPGMPNATSMAGRIGGLTSAAPAAGTVDWPTAIATAAEMVLSELVRDEGAAVPAVVARRSVQQANRRSSAGVALRVVSRSRTFGRAVASRVLQRARGDGRTSIRGRSYSVPTGPGRWAPATGKSAVQPFWGTLRPFAMSGSSSCRPAPPVAFSTAPTSAFRAEALAVRDAAATMRTDDRHSAFFWADLPGQSATPPGHWLQLAAQLVREEALPLDVALETMLLAGLAAHDAFVACWEAKYHWNVLRPDAYLRANVHAGWTPLLETPSFPEYPSGHSAVSQAVAQVLAAQLGDRAFVDRTRVAAGLGSRSHAGLLDAAEEAAQSRLFGGIHFPMGKSAGLAQGDCVADAVLGLVSATP